MYGRVSVGASRAIELIGSIWLSRAAAAANLDLNSAAAQVGAAQLIAVRKVTRASVPFRFVRFSFVSGQQWEWREEEE